PNKDQKGVDYWTDCLKKNEQGGQKGFGGVKMVQMFIVGASGKEYADKKKSNSDFLLDMYAVLMGRDRDTVMVKDKKGYDYWMERLDSGEGREIILKSMANCDEFKNICKDAGIQVGDFDYYMPASKYPQLAKFVARFYPSCMGRDFDEEGVNFWTGAIKDGTQSVDSMSNFFFTCKEWNDLGLDLNNKVIRLYNTFFGRTPLLGERSWWVAEINNGKRTWTNVYLHFANSSEFKQIKGKYGL
ncbi:MAG: DUF4214 domain-containing protein, partial [Lachnospiraceae bacterium]|nr:DUF4214 domain-containing protein [Lachnospiraceae bacterium]